VIAKTRIAHSKMVNSDGLPILTGKCSGDRASRRKAVYFITGVAEATGLAAVAVDRQVFSSQGLFYEIRNNAAVIELHARPVSVEDPYDSSVHVVGSVIGHGGGFGELFCLVVTERLPMGFTWPQEVSFWGCSSGSP